MNVTLRAVAGVTLVLIAGCGAVQRAPAIVDAPPDSRARWDALLPLPASVSSAVGAFELRSSAEIDVESGQPQLVAVAELLARALRPATGYALPVRPKGQPHATGHLYLTTTCADPSLGDEGYTLEVEADRVTIRATTARGAFYGVQTLRQLFAPAIELPTRQRGPWILAAGRIVDRPRFAWRGLMFDVARHFMNVDGVKRYIDLASRFKINRFHLHLSDDQGWRIEIGKWPDLTSIGGGTAVGGGPGGFYSQAQYREIVTYAAERFMTVIPEIEMPGHCKAALASYASLNCDGVAPALDLGTGVGKSSLCLSNPLTYQFIDDVVGEIAAMTPGGFMHIGGDETFQTSATDYSDFITRVERIVASHGMRMVGWEEIVLGGASAHAIVQAWRGLLHPGDLASGAQIILSPASRMYLDMKYGEDTRIGQTWAGLVEVDDAYNWDPVVDFAFPESSLLGVEAPLWTEYVANAADGDLLMYPRLIGHAEIGWTPQTRRHLGDYLRRLGAWGPRLDALGIGYYRSSRVAWAHSGQP